MSDVTITEERIRELRDSHMVKVRNLPQPTLDELVKLLNSTEDLSVQILPNGEVLATTCPDSTAFVAICDELLRHRAQAGWQPIESAPRDGTLVDLWHKVGTRICEVWWTDDCWSNCSDDSDYTHWRPVPNDPPPKVIP